MKVIQTRYKGYHFRSRTEARWAVFFDELGIEWRYEMEGYDLGPAGYYLPDFYLPGVEMIADATEGPLDERTGVFIEIKAGEPSKMEIGKARALVAGLGEHQFNALICILVGEVSNDNNSNLVLEFTTDNDDIRKGHVSKLPAPFFAACYRCGSISISVKGAEVNICQECGHHGDFSHNLSGIYERDEDAPTITAAVAAARSARFEHGYCGAT